MRVDEEEGKRLEAISARNKASKNPVPDVTPRPGKSSNRSKLETAFADQLSLAGLPVATREHRFHPKRRWQFDFAWPVFRLAVEIEGGLYGKSRHTTMTGFNADCEKYNTATLMGWRVLRVTDRHIKSGEALEWAKEGIRR